MEIEQLQEEEMYVLVAPDGSPQLMTLAPDFAMCCGMAELLASKGISQPIDKMFANGFNIMPVKVTITQNGNENDAFEKFKKQIKRKK